MTLIFRNKEMQIVVLHNSNSKRYRYCTVNSLFELHFFLLLLLHVIPPSFPIAVVWKLQRDIFWNQWHLLEPTLSNHRTIWRVLSQEIQGDPTQSDQVRLLFTCCTQTSSMYPLYTHPPPPYHHKNNAESCHTLELGSLELFTKVSGSPPNNPRKLPWRNCTPMHGRRIRPGSFEKRPSTDSSMVTPTLCTYMVWSLLELRWENCQTIGCILSWAHLSFYFFARQWLFWSSCLMETFEIICKIIRRGLS